MTIAEDIRRQENASKAGDSAVAGFAGGPWQDGIDVRDFIQRNYTPYAGDSDFLAGATARSLVI